MQARHVCLLVLVMALPPPEVKAQCKCSRCEGTGEKANENKVNLAFNKPTMMSSVFRSSSLISTDGCGIVNGIQTTTLVGISSASPNCILTDPTDKNPWWEVTLDQDNEQLYTISQLLITRRSQMKAGVDVGLSELEGLDISVGGQLCFHFPDTLTDEHKGNTFTVTCTEPLTGRHVRLSKPPALSEGDVRQIGLCELQIWVCKPGYYLNGATCAACPASTTCQYICNNLVGCMQNATGTLAVKKTSSSSNSGELARVVDRVLENFDLSRHCFVSRPKPRFTYHWISADLWQTARVHGVRIRTYCCVQQNSGGDSYEWQVYVHMLQHTFRDQVPDDYIHCKNYTERKGTTLHDVVCEPEPPVGKFVTLLQHEDRGALIVCQFMIIGIHVTEHDYGQRCYPERKYETCKVHSTCVVKASAYVQEYFCWVLIGGNCQGRRQNHCVEHVGCEAGYCKLKQTQYCYPHHPRMCMCRFICDVGHYRQCKPRDGQWCDVASARECRGGSVCDLNFMCGRPPDSPCDDVTVCTTGARCVDGKCQCDSETSVKGTKTYTPFPLCLPKNVGYPLNNCNTAGSCSTNFQNLRCVGWDWSDPSYRGRKRCECNEGYNMDHDYICRKKVGLNCTSAEQCSLGLVCEDGRCKKKTGQECTDPAPNEPQYCDKRSKCDRITRLCKIPVGDNCSDVDLTYLPQEFHCDVNFCEDGSKCENNMCKLLLGKKCTPDQAHLCENRTVCYVAPGAVNGTCLLKPGAPCKDGNADICVPPTVCGDDLMCRVPANSNCTQGTETCELGLICDIDGMCRKGNGSACTNDSECAEGLACDAFGQCTIKQDENCTNSNMCVAGATCINGKCQCNTAVSTLNETTGKCDPNDGRPGGNCKVQADGSCKCDVPAAVVDPVTNKCRCPTDKQPERSDYSCGGGTDSECSSTKPCVSGMVCNLQTSTCFVEVGGNCQGDLALKCEPGAVCSNDKLCRSVLGGKCPCGRNDLCEGELVCDASCVCVEPSGGDCGSKDDCAAGSKCSDVNSTCVCDDGIAVAEGETCDINEGELLANCKTSIPPCVDPNAVCINNTCVCGSKYLMDRINFICKLGPGQPCIEECAEGLVCDPITKRCSVPIGDPCFGGRAEFCVNGSICDVTNFCKIDTNNSCHGEEDGVNLELHCKWGTFCDFYGKCKTGVAQKCDPNNTECGVGAVCKPDPQGTYRCRCQPPNSVEYGFICGPDKCRVGAPCCARGTCTDQRATCVDGVCQCEGEETFRSESDFVCGARAARQAPSTNDRTLLLALLLAGALALVVCIPTVGYLKQRRNRQAIEKIGQKRRNTVQLLAAEVDHFIRAGGSVHSYGPNVDTGDDDASSAYSEQSSQASEYSDYSGYSESRL